MLNRYGRKTRIAALGTALGTVMIFTGTVSARAATPATARHSAVTMKPDAPGSWFSGDTYPLTPAGLSACQAQGVYDVAHVPLADWYTCSPGDPDAGLYGLWLHYDPN